MKELIPVSTNTKWNLEDLSFKYSLSVETLMFLIEHGHEVWDILKEQYGEKKEEEEDDE